ncbi:hypothetical protein G7046_g8297 [Stylonectria norvegica]|nr:hypothetical protein G7046_g8297 [Stylonectria norvegica]
MPPYRPLPKRLVPYTSPRDGWVHRPYNCHTISRPTSATALQLPAVPLTESSLWRALDGFERKSDAEKRQLIASAATEIEAEYAQDGEGLHRMPKSLLLKHGETAYHVLRRVWYLHLAYTTTPRLPGPEINEDSFISTLRIAVLQHMYIGMFEVQMMRALEHWEDQDARPRHLDDGTPTSDMLSREYEDCMARLSYERGALILFQTQVKRSQATGHFDYEWQHPHQLFQDCVDAVLAYHGSDGQAESEDEDEELHRHVALLWLVATRMVEEWNLQPLARTIELWEIVAVYSKALRENAL